MGNRLVDTLRLVGLTEYETRAYLVLTSFGGLTANELSEKSNIPYSRIYDVVAKLEQKNWVEIDNQRPKRIYPSNPVGTLTKVKKGISQSIDYAIDELKVIAKNRPLIENALILVLKSWNQTEQMMHRMLMNVKQEAVLVLGFPHAMKRRSMKEILGELQKRRVRTTVILRNSPDVLASYRDTFNDCSSTVVGSPPQLIMLYADWASCVVAFPSIENEVYDYRRLTSLYITHPAIISLSRVAITSYWNDSKPYTAQSVSDSR